MNATFKRGQLITVIYPGNYDENLACFRDTDYGTNLARNGVGILGIPVSARFGYFWEFQATKKPLNGGYCILVLVSGSDAPRRLTAMFTVTAHGIAPFLYQIEMSRFTGVLEAITSAYVFCRALP